MGNKTERKNKRKEYDEIGNKSSDPVNEIITKADELFRLMVEGTNPTFEEWQELMGRVPVTQKMIYYAIYKKFD